jgi:RNA polymerase sigma factor (sigma-70 family)
MSPTELERPLEAGALREIERSLYGKLKAHRLSDSFIGRFGEEALQEGLVEYFRAVKNGQEIDNRDAFVVKAAFFRAIDKLRREARESDSAAVEAFLERDRLTTPASDEVAIEHLAAEELHRAISTLGTEERQALRLHYFEQLSNEKSAEILYCSERTFRRRLTKALGDLSRRLGVPAPEPDSELAIEVGLAAWASLAGARVVPANGLIDHATAALDATLHLPASILGRARDLTARLLASDASEKVTVLAGAPAARAGGAFCTGALALCLVTGAVGPGIGGLGIGEGHGRGRAQNAAPRHPLAKPGTSRPTVASEVQPPQSASGNSFGRQATDPGDKATRPNRVQRDRYQVKQQTRSLARVGNESTPASPPTPPVSSSTSTETEASATPASGTSSESGEAAQAKQQFGAFK